MSVGTGIVLAGIWIFAAACGISPYVRSWFFMVSFLTAAIMTIWLCHS